MDIDITVRLSALKYLFVKTYDIKYNALTQREEPVFIDYINITCSHMTI